MKKFLTLFAREVSRNVFQPVAWIVLACFLVLTGINFQVGVIAMNAAPSSTSAVEAFFNSIPFWFPFLLCVPLLTMRLFSEEYRLGTIETLMTAPVRDGEVVLAKFFGALVFFVLLWAPSGIYFLAFTWTSGVPAAGSVGSVVGAYLLLLLAGSFYLSLGCLASSLTDNQIIAGILAAAFICVAFFLGLVWFFFPTNDPTLRELAYFFSTIEHMGDFSRGIFDTRPMVLYTTATALVLFLTYQTVQRRRWKA